MKHLRNYWLALSLLALSPGFASATPPSCATVEPERSYELGLGLQSLLPNDLPGLSNSLLMYGPSFAVPFLGQQAVLRASYGSIDALSGYLIELSYRAFLPLPFFQLFGVIGGQVLRYTNAGSADGTQGGHAGFGLSFPMGTSNHWTLGTKLLVMRKSLMSFDLLFSFVL